MGYGPIINGKQMPITPWKGSWAEQEQRRREGKPVPSLPSNPNPSQWPLGMRPGAVRFSIPKQEK